MEVLGRGYEVEVGRYVRAGLGKGREREGGGGEVGGGERMFCSELVAGFFFFF